MHFDRPRIRAARRLLAITAAALTGLTAAAVLPLSAAHAATIADLEAQASRIADQIAVLDGELTHLNEEYEFASGRLKATEREIDETAAELKAEQEQLGEAREDLVDRAVTIYQTGAASDGLVQLAASASLEEFVTRLDAVEIVSQEDAAIVRRLEAIHARIKAKQEELTSLRATQAEAAAQARRAKERAERKRAERQGVLDGIEGEIAELVAAEQARRAAAAAAAAEAAAAEARAQAEAEQAAQTTTTPVPDGQSAPSEALASPIAPPPSASGAGAAAANWAMGQIGKPYQWGATGPDSFDCSGLVYAALAATGGPSIGRTTYDMINAGSPVSQDQMQYGDLVFSHAGHVGIYVGGGNMVHAPQSGDVVHVAPVYAFYAARRL